MGGWGSGASPARPRTATMPAAGACSGAAACTAEMNAQRMSSGSVPTAAAPACVWAPAGITPIVHAATMATVMETTKRIAVLEPIVDPDQRLIPIKFGGQRKRNTVLGLVRSVFERVEFDQHNFIVATINMAVHRWRRGGDLEA